MPIGPSADVEAYRSDASPLHTNHGRDLFASQTGRLK
jgi:hypothetical protein